MENNLSEEAKGAMRSASGWIKFYAIVMIVVCAISLVAGFILIGEGRPQDSTIGTAIIIVAAISIVVMIILMQYAFNLGKSGYGDSSLLGSAFNKQKIYFIIAGVLAIIGLLSNLNNFFKSF